MGVSVLGPVGVDGRDSLGPRDRVVLAALAVRAGEVVGGDELADALWGDAVPASWNKVVQGCIVRLRRALGPDAIRTEPGGYRLALPYDDVDAHRFERMVRRARELLTLGEPERAAHVLDEALALWRGRPLPELHSWDPGRIEANRLDELRLDAEELHVDAALAAGRHREMLATARGRVDQAPIRERRWAQLALAQYRVGRQAEALRTVNEARTVLARELGISPGPELVALEQAMLQQDPSLAPPSASAEPSGSCPWPGLVSYDVIDSELFFGREAEVSAALRRLSDTGVLAVVGPSGSGKSSLVRAGVAAALERDGRRVIIVVPGGARPIDSLAKARDAAGSPVLIVDQCEQAITQGADAEQQRAFFAALVAWAERAPLVVALRADRMGEASAHEAFARLLERGLFLLGPMSEAELCSAIEGPARHAGVLLERGLVDLVVRDVLDEPGALPLMSHALRQTWARREGPTLTVDAYRETGGIRGAVAQTAEAVYGDLVVEEQSRLRDLLLRLVAPSDSGEPVRARVPRDALVADEAHEHLVERLVRARLVTTDEGVVEIAHEALARAWPRLQDWLEEDEAGLRVLRHLTSAAAGWEALGRPDSELYRGVRLAQALDWRERTHPEMTAAEAAFLERSAEQEATAVRHVEEQVRRERRTVRRLRRLAAGVTALALATAAISWVAVDQRRRADDEAAVADARRIAAQALEAEPPDLALLLAVEAVRRWDSEETRGNLLTTIERNPLVAQVLRTQGRGLEIQVSPTGDRAVVLDNLGTLTLYDLDSGETLATRREGGVAYRSAVFAPDGDQVAVSRFPVSCRFGLGCEEGVVELLDGHDLQPLGVSYRGLGNAAVAVSFSPRGDLVAAAPSPAYARDGIGAVIWDVDEPGVPIARIPVNEPGVDLSPTPDHLSRAWIGFSQDGAAVSVSGAGPVQTFEIATGAVLDTVPSLGALALSRDGNTLAVAADERTVALYDNASGERRALLGEHDGLVIAAAFSADGRLLATAGNDETVIVWDVATGTRRQVLRGHTGSVNAVSFGPTSDVLYSTGADRSVLVWDLEGRRSLARQLTGSTLATTAEASVFVSPRGDTFAVLEEDAHIVDVQTGRTTSLLLDEPREAGWGAYSSDGRRFATVAYDGRVKVWDVGDAEPVVTAAGRGNGNLGALAFTPDGAIVVADEDGTVTELDGRTLRPTGRSLSVPFVPIGIRATVGDVVAVTGAPIEDPSAGTPLLVAKLDGRVIDELTLDQPLARANFSPDGSRYAVGGYDGRLGILDLASGRIGGPRDPIHPGPIAWVTFAPDMATLVTIGFDGQVVLADATTGVPRARLRPGRTNLRATAGYAADGHTLLLAYTDGSAISYEIDSDAWIAHACRVAGRNLTAAEWHDRFGAERQRPTCP